MDWFIWFITETCVTKELITIKSVLKNKNVNQSKVITVIAVS